jgi:putative ABC transport system permease protein
MKKTLLKDTFREIRRTFSRFLAILCIIALGTAFFVGIKTTCPDMKLTADKYFKDNSFMDFQLISTAGFTDDDVSAIKKEVNGVKGVMPIYSVDAVSAFDGKQKVVSISSLPSGSLTNANDNYINRVDLIKGRLPNKSGECVIEINKITNVTPNVGDKIALSSGNDSNLADTLKATTYTVVGIIRSPLYISKDRGTSSIGNGQVSAFMQIPATDFKLDYATGVFVTVNMNPSIQAYSKKYDDEIAKIKSTLETFASKRAEVRYTQIKTDAQNTLDGKKKDYETSVTKANSELAAAEKKITDGQLQIDSGKSQLAKSKIQLESTLTDSQNQINQGKLALSSAMTDYQSKADAFNKQKQMAIAAGYYDAQKAVFDAGEAQLQSAKLQLDGQQATLVQKQQLLDSSKADGEKQIADNLAKLEKSQKTLDKAKSTYNQNKAQTEQKLSDAKKQLDDAQSQINDIAAVKWYVLGRSQNYGYVDYGNAADRMDAISQIFPIIFVLVAILICLTSMSRMVEEQRMYMGTVKSLGYKKSSIAVKFLLYAILASVLGGSIGLAVGFSFFPPLINNAYSVLYSLPKLILLFDVPFAAFSLTVGILVTTLSALIVSFGELSSNAATLMRPRAPKAGKIILLERITLIWKRMKFTQKVTARNLFRYKSRFFMTVIGVGGCTALLLVGFGLNDAITTIGSKQYGEIYTYQLTVNYKDNIAAEQIQNIKDKLQTQSEFSSMQSLFEKNIDIGYKAVGRTCNLVVPEDRSKITNFITLRDRTTHSKIPLTDDGVVLTEKLANLLGAKVGDTIYLKDGDTKRYNVKVTGICENYLQHYLYMSTALYKKLYGSVPEYNQIDIKLKTVSASAQQNVSENIVPLKGVSSVNLIGDNTKKFSDTIRSVYFIILVLIISAALLSFIVLYTLTNINISERIREIATIKVLGFYDKEVSAYVFRENIILTVLGAGFGLIIGLPLAKFVIGTAEIDMLMFGRQIYPKSFIISALLTLAFSWFVNLVMLRKLKKVDMVESLKSIE